MKTMRSVVVAGSLVAVVLAAVLAVGIHQAFGQATEPNAPKTAMSDANAKYFGALVIAAGVAGGLGFIGAGYAVGHVGAAALGAASERPEMLVKSLIFVALGEGIAILGLVIAFWLILKLPA